MTSPFRLRSCLALGGLDRFFKYRFRAPEDHTLPAANLRYNPLLEKARKDLRLGEVSRRAGLPYDTHSRPLLKGGAMGLTPEIVISSPPPGLRVF